MLTRRKLLQLLPLGAVVAACRKVFGARPAWTNAPDDSCPDDPVADLWHAAKFKVSAHMKVTPKDFWATLGYQNSDGEYSWQTWADGEWGAGFARNLCEDPKFEPLGWSPDFKPLNGQTVWMHQSDAGFWFAYHPLLK